MQTPLNKNRKTMKNLLSRTLVSSAASFLLASAALSQGVGPTAGRVSATEPPAVESKGILPHPRERFGAGIARLEGLSKADLSLNRELVELLHANPALQCEVANSLRSGTVSLKASETLVFLLAKVGTESAQRELALIQADPTLRRMDRLRAIMGMGSLPDPTVATVDALWVTTGRRLDIATVDLANTALLALGSLGSRMRATTSPRYAEVRDGLVAKLLGATSAPEVAMTLKAVGNLGDVSLGNRVASYLYDRSAPVRASAAQTLGRIRDESKRVLLMDLLPRERIGSVRAYITQALRDLPADQETLGFILGIVRNERHLEARSLMVTYLAEHLAEFEESIETLVEMTSTDPSNRVRLLAGAALRY